MDQRLMPRSPGHGTAGLRPAANADRCVARRQRIDRAFSMPYATHENPVGRETGAIPTPGRWRPGETSPALGFFAHPPRTSRTTITAPPAQTSRPRHSGSSPSRTRTRARRARSSSGPWRSRPGRARGLAARETAACPGHMGRELIVAQFWGRRRRSGQQDGKTARPTSPRGERTQPLPRTRSTFTSDTVTPQF